MSNDTETLTLSDFLLARIAEDEQSAVHWLNNQRRWGKASARRFLAECAAKRRIVKLHPPTMLAPDFCDTCANYQTSYHEPYPCPTLRLMAEPYADHPDFRDEWRA